MHAVFDESMRLKKSKQHIALSIIFQICILFISTGRILGQIEGVVLDVSNQSPLPGATIILGDSTFSTSDPQGVFRIDPPFFPIILKASYIGYEPFSSVLETNTGKIKIELRASNYMLGEVIVTAYEGRQKIMEAPGSIAMLPQKEIEIDNDAYFIPALNRVTGIYAHSGTYNTNRITIRGIGSRSLFITSKIRAYYDNIPLTTGDGETTVEDIDPSLIDRLEIIKGPSSSLYGAGLGGTLLVRSKLPSSQDKYLRYGITGGSFGYLKNDLDFVYGSDRSRTDVAVNWIRSDGYRDNNAYDRLTAGISYKNYLNDKSSLTFLMNYIKLYAQIPSSIDSITYQTDPRAAAPNWAASEGYEDNQKFISGMAFNHTFSPHSSLEASVFYTFRDSYESRPFNMLDDDNHALGGRAIYEYQRDFGKYRFNFIAGGEYFIDFYGWKIYENDNRENGDLLSDNEESRENINAFLKADLTFPFQTYLTLGFNINRTHYDYQSLYAQDGSDNSGDYSFGTTVSPRIAISHPITPDIHVYGNISHGFSPPSLAETLTPSGAINPEIEPEKGMNYEAGSKGLVFKKKLFYEITLFSMHIKDLIVAQRVSEDEFIGVNAGKTVNRGLEVVLNYDFLGIIQDRKKLTGFVTYTLADYNFEDFVEAGNDFSGNPLTGVPRNVFNAGLAFNIPAGFYGNLNYQFVDQIPMNDANSAYSEAYQLVNLKLGYARKLSNHFNIDVHGILNNVLDEKYASMISVNALSFGGALPRYYYPGLPRHFYIGASLQYNL